MQEGALNILKKLDGICREQGLRYFLFYGTLIGAIRHKGFIPWDDDLDVAMPRPDFDKLVAYCRQHRQELQPMQLMTVDDNPQYVYPIARFSDTRYRVKYQGIRDYGLGLFVDIYPLDGCGNTEEEAKAWVQQPMRDVKFINCCAADRFTPSRRGWLHTPAKLAGFAWARLHGSAHYIHRIEAWARQKDYENPFRRATYRNEDEMIAAIGTLDDNSFVKQIKAQSEENLSLLEELKSRIN